MRDADPVAGAIEPRELERVRARYAGYASAPRKQRAWSAANPGNGEIRRELLDAIWGRAASDLLGQDGEAPGGGVLDAGCGTGWWLNALLGRGVRPERLHGVDALTERVDACHAGLPATVDVRHADVRALPFPDAGFDAVLLLTVLSSLAGPADVRQALEEAARVARAGGVVLIYEPRFGLPVGGLRTAVPAELVRATLGPVDELPVTVWPPLARRLGRFTEGVYPRLAGRRWATSHRLLVHRKAA